MEEEEEQVTEKPYQPYAVERLIGWARIQSPVSSPQNQFKSQSGSESPSPNEWSTNGIDISNREIMIFPPINHEGLHISSSSSFHSRHENHREIDHPISDFEPTNSPLPSPRPRPPAVSGGGTTWLDLVVQFLRCKLTCISSRLGNYSTRGFLLYFRSPAARLATAMVAVMWYLRFRRRRRVLRVRSESGDQLIRIIREKDEKIDGLLRQIAKMNEILLSLHTLHTPKPT